MPFLGKIKKCSLNTGHRQLKNKKKKCDCSKISNIHRTKEILKNWISLGKVDFLMINNIKLYD